LTRALAALALLLLVGCGGTAASLDDATEATSAETARFEMRFRVTGEPEKLNFEMQASGSFDFPNERAEMMISGDMPFFDPAKMSWKEFRLFGTTGYMRWVVKGKAYWVKSEENEPSGDPTELLVPLPGTPTRPTDVLARVLAASEETEELGQETIRGAKVTHYRARVNVRRLVQQLPPKDRPDHVSGPRFVPVEMWIDENSRLRRITTEQVDDGETATMMLELYDYGVEVDVEPPPENETISEEEFDKLTGELSPGEAGEAEPLSPDEICADAREHLPKKEADELCASLKEKE
jgi:LppX_LprAFG lipoprotein